MSQINDVKREIQEAKKLRLSWRTKLLIIVIGAPTTFLFALYGRLELALPLMNIIGVLGLMILFKWKLRKQAWFWVTMAVIAALHVPLILFIPWGTRWVPALASDSRHRLGRFLPDPLDSCCCREIHGKTDDR